MTVCSSLHIAIDLFICLSFSAYSNAMTKNIDCLVFNYVEKWFNICNQHFDC